MLSFALLLAQNSPKSYTKVEGRDGGMLTQIIYFYEHYNCLLIYFITNSHLLLDCLYVVLLHILVQKMTFSIFTHNPKTL